MAKIPSRKFSTAKKKIPSRPFPKGSRKITSRKLVNSSTKIPSRKFARATEAANQNQDVNAQAPLDRPSDEQTRQDRVAKLKGRTDALKTANEL